MITVYYCAPSSTNPKHLGSGMQRMKREDLASWVIARSEEGILIITDIVEH